MSVVNLNQVSQSFGDFDVFRGVTASIAHHDKIGLVGPNGIGKTTLLLTLAGLSEPSSGAVHHARGIRLGYLRQEAMDAFTERDHTLYEEMLTVFTNLRAQEARLREMEIIMASGVVVSDLLEHYGSLQERFEQAGGYEYELRLEQTLTGLGFKRHHWAMPLRQLSGGQKTRALLARLLLERPDLLILDEPTNHLDVEAVEWLEQQLYNWHGALVIVSHDRYFLDRVVNTIWELNRNGVVSYRGSYSAYLRQRHENWERHQKIYEQEMERLEKELDYIKRNIARASTNGMAVGRLRRLSRDLVAIEELGIIGVQGKSWSETGIGSIRPYTIAEAERAIKAIHGPQARPPRLNLNLEPVAHSGVVVLRTRALLVGYPNNPLFTADDITLNRGECAALIGPNGAGKTTFLRTILEHLQPLSGHVRLGVNVRVGYFAQVHDGLDENQSVIAGLIQHQPMGQGAARSFLARYLFRGDDVFKSIGALSGGERARLALAILSLDSANFLLLDEPTNHLDIPAQEALQETLEDFEGTVLLVSHDRYLISRLATQIWDLNDGHLSVFNSPYAEYLDLRDQSLQSVV